MALRDDEMPFNADIEMNRLCDNEVATLDRVILQGGCKDFAQYKELCGKREGLMTMQKHFIDLVDKWNRRG